MIPTTLITAKLIGESSVDEDTTGAIVVVVVTGSVEMGFLIRDCVALVGKYGATD
jgi:hypothetical protein